MLQPFRTPQLAWTRRRILGVALLLIITAIAVVMMSLRSSSAVVVQATQEIKPAVPDLLSTKGVTEPGRVDYRRLDSRIALLMQEKDFVGLAVAAVERGKVRFLRGYGETLAGSGDPVTPDTVFRWASVSKGVASALVTKLAKEGRVSLEAPVEGLNTSLKLSPAGRNVTVADVLSHRVGIVRNAWDDRLEQGADPRALRAQLGTLPLLCPPASCYAYQNIAYDTAAEIVEHAAGQPYGDLAHARLFAPIGMTSASVGRLGLQSAPSWARPHRGRTPVTVKDAYYRVPAAGGVNSSVSDLARWMLAQMGKAPDVLSAEMLQTMHMPRVSTPPAGRRSGMERALTQASYGLGWRSFNYAGHALVGHRGAVEGYGALVLFDPAEQSGIVMLWNSGSYNAARLQLEFFDMLYGLPPTDWLDLPASRGQQRTARAGAGRAG